MQDLWLGIAELLAPSHCAGCEEPSRSVFCAACEPLVERSSSSSAVFHYGGPVADAIHRYKYRGRSDLSRALGGLMADAVSGSAGSVDAVVPVPLHWRRRRSRGYDQATLLAKPVARALGVPLWARGLRRVRPTKSQVDLPHHQRRANVTGAFVASRLPKAERVLLVDDVRTTGATLREAAGALRSRGILEVRTLVLAARVLDEAT